MCNYSSLQNFIVDSREVNTKVILHGKIQGVKKTDYLILFY